jgi:hypothetical protein
VDLPLFFGIFGLAGAEQFRQVFFSFPVRPDSNTRLCVPYLRNGALDTVRGPKQKEAPILDALATQLDGLCIFGRVEKTPGGGRSA